MREKIQADRYRDRWPIDNLQVGESWRIFKIMSEFVDGIETLKRIRKTKPDLQVILLTGQGNLQKGVEAMKLGALDFLEKPADIQTMLKKVEEAAAKRAILVEKRMEEKLSRILKEKPW